MKKSVKIAIPLLLVAVMLLTALSVFVFTATAQEARADAEAKLDTYVGESLASSESGALTTLAAKLTSLAPTEATRYVLTLTKDVSVSATIELGGNKNTEIVLDLGAYTLTSTASNAIKVSGSGTALRVKNGALNASATAIYAADGTSVYTEGTAITTSGAVFDGDVNVSPDDSFNADVYVYDTAIVAQSGVIFKNCITVYLYPGTTTIAVGANELQSGLNFKSGCSAVKNALGVYELAVSGHTIRMPKVFANGMMLQRNKQINIYGYCLTANAQIRVTLAGITKTVTVASEALGSETFGSGYAGETYYRWQASFDPMAAAFNQTITIDQLDADGNEVAAGVDVTVSNVNIGEIWVMSGQSNASLAAGFMEDLEEMQALAGTIKIRTYASSGISTFPTPLGNGVWAETTASTLAKTSTSDKGMVSAILYPMVCKLAAELGPDVPVGAVTVAQGSSKIITWVDYEHLAELNPTFAAYYLDYALNGVIPDGFSTKAYAERYGGTVLYNKHIYPLEGYTTAGVLWYQGCGDIKQTYLGTGPDGKNVTYTQYFEALEEVYRRAFGNGSEDLPFYVMQLAPYSRSDTEGTTGINNLTNFKYQQYDFCSSLPNTYLVSLGTDGMVYSNQDLQGGAFIHPARKSSVALRTADMILANEYDIKVADVYSYPVPLSAVRTADGKVIVTFDTNLTVFYGIEVKGFDLKVGGSWKTATAVIDGNKLILSAPGVGEITDVRYGYGRQIFELKDGTLVEVDGDNYSASKGSTSGWITDAITGVKYTITVDSTDVVRSMTPGNLTNDSGIPMPLFQLSVTAE